MADLGNQLEGVTAGLERYLDALDNASIKLSSNTALETKFAKIAGKMSATNQKFDKNLLKSKKENLKLQTDLNKGLKTMSAGLKDFGNKALGGVKKMAGGIAKAGIIGGLVVGVKFLIDGLLKVDNAMAGLVKRTKLTRVELAGVREAALDASMSIGIMGPSFEQVVAEAGNLVETFGRVDMVTEKLIKDSLALQQGYGVAAAEAGKLTEALARTARSGEEFRNTIRAIAGKDGVSASLLMRSMAAQAQQIAIQNQRGTESMAEMASFALKAGVSLSEMGGMRAAFSDFGTIVNNMSTAGSLMGEEFRKSTMNAQQYLELNRTGATGRAQIQKDFLKGMRATVYLDEEHNMRMISSGKLLAEMEAEMIAVSNAYGISLESAYSLTKEDLKRAKFGPAKKKELTDAEHLAQIYRDQLGVLETIGQMFTGIAGKITAAFSAALGIDSDTGVRGMLKDLELELEHIFDFPNLQSDIKDAEGRGMTGFGAFVDAMGKRLEKLGDSIFTAMQTGLEKAINWFQESYEFDWWEGGFVKTDKGILNDFRELQESLANAENESEKMNQSLIEHDALGKDNLRTKQEALAEDFKGKELEKEKLKLQDQYDNRRAAIQRRIVEAQDAELAAEDELMAYAETDRMREVASDVGREVMVEEIGLAGEALDLITYDWQQKLGAAAAGVDLEKKGIEKLMKGGSGEIRSVGKEALGGIGGRRLSIVGEAGGEVVASRSALRSGIGIGGRAASALAGIGVPGYRTGYADFDVSDVFGRKGEMGAQGSQEYIHARASALQKESARQQAAMMEYWRKHYEDKMDTMVDEKVKKEAEKDKKGPPWLAKFFLKYNKQIGEQLQKTGPTMSAAIMSGMTKWSQGGDLSDAIKVGARAGIVAGINDPDSKLNKYLEQTGEWQKTLKVGLAAFAQGQSLGDSARAMVGIGSEVLAKKLFTGKATSRASEYLGMSMGAKGKYVNSPTLMMVGEGGAGEVVIPTDRIRKGLPINAGVARELASIGVPGFQDGYAQERESLMNVGTAVTRPSANTLPEWEEGTWAPTSGPSAWSHAGDRFAKLGGFSGMAQSGGAGAVMTFGNVFQQTGDWKQAATAGAGAGIGVAAGMGLTALGIPPPLSGMVGNMIGGLAAKGLNAFFNLTGGYGKGRRKSLSLIEDHIKSGGRFDYGAPSGLSKAMGQAVGGYEKTPTQANFQKLVEEFGTSKLVASMGVPGPALIALGMGQMRGSSATKMYSGINMSLYGKSGDKYRKALAVKAVPSMAAGGIVNRPTTALIGESGPEAVIPLRNSEMIQELKKQNKLMIEMIKTQKETAKTEIRMDGRIVAETIGKNFYDISTG